MFRGHRCRCRAPHRLRRKPPQGSAFAAGTFTRRALGRFILALFSARHPWIEVPISWTSCLTASFHPAVCAAPCRFFVAASGLALNFKEGLLWMRFIYDGFGGTSTMYKTDFLGHLISWRQDPWKNPISTRICHSIWGSIEDAADDSETHSTAAWWTAVAILVHVFVCAVHYESGHYYCRPESFLKQGLFLTGRSWDAPFRTCRSHEVSRCPRRL